MNIIFLTRKHNYVIPGCVSEFHALEVEYSRLGSRSSYRWRPEVLIRYSIDGQLCMLTWSYCSFDYCSFHQIRSPRFSCGENKCDALWLTSLISLSSCKIYIFWLAAIYHAPVSRRLVKLAYVAYKEPTVMLDIHEDIKKYVEGQTVRDRLQRDSALSKIIELLNENRIDTQEMFRLKRDMGDVDFSRKDDESWVV